MTSALAPDDDTDASSLLKHADIAVYHAHSDRNSQYTSEHFRKLLAEQGITFSMSLARDIWDIGAYWRPIH